MAATAAAAAVAADELHGSGGSGAGQRAAHWAEAERLGNIPAKLVAPEHIHLATSATEEQCLSDMVAAGRAHRACDAVGHATAVSPPAVGADRAVVKTLHRPVHRLQRLQDLQRMRGTRPCMCAGLMASAASNTHRAEASSARMRRRDVDGGARSNVPAVPIPARQLVRRPLAGAAAAGAAASR